MYVHGCRAGTGKRGSNLFANVARLAHANHYYAPLAGQYYLAGLYEVGIYTIE